MNFLLAFGIFFVNKTQENNRIIWAKGVEKDVAML